MNDTSLLGRNTALLLVDIQQAFLQTSAWGLERSTPEAEQNAARLLAYWREQGMPLYHVQHYSLNPTSPLAPGQTGQDFHVLVHPHAGEPVIAKSVNSAFIGTDLQVRLDARHIKTLVVVGLTTDHCVSTTVRMAANYGYKVWVVADATATFDRTGAQNEGAGDEHYSAALMHRTALASLAEEFATVITTQSLLAALSKAPILVQQTPSNSIL
jgi:nicotinamidase-related amidase